MKTLAIFVKFIKKMPLWFRARNHLKSGKFYGWNVAQRIGKGQFGKVHLLISQSHDQTVSLKVINMKKHDMEIDAFKQEIAIHKQLRHPNVIEMFDSKVEGDSIFLFIEYASNGDLFERIVSNKPTEALTLVDAHRYFTQLIAGVEYLHQRGIAHRDLKPENLLIDKHGTLKIADFGMAVTFCNEEVEWLMTDFCGSLPSMAPEVFTRRYRAEPADVWSCGIVLVNMLTKQRPWEEPTMRSRQFVSWVRSQNTNCLPWICMTDSAIQLLKEVLHPFPSRRATIESIKQSHYYTNGHLLE